MLIELKRLVWFLALIISCTIDLSAQTIPDSTLKKIDDIFKKWDNTYSPGCTVGIVRNDSLIFSKGYGMANLEYAIPNTPATVFHMASISKQFTAFANEIAGAAKEPAHLAGDMAVIDTQPAGGLLPADGADAELTRQHEVVIPQRHAVEVFELRIAVLFRTIGALLRAAPGIFRRSAPPLCVDLVPVGRVAVALVRAHARAVVGVLRGLPLLCQALA